MTATSLVIGSSHKDNRTLLDKIQGTAAFSHIWKEKDVNRAISSVRTRPVDMIFYDVIDPARETYAWIHQLYADQKGCDVPVFLFARAGAEDEKIRGLEAGACDFLSFDTSAKELAARIRTHLEKKQQLTLLRQAKEDLEKQATTDGLTGLFNRRFFQRALEAEVARSSRLNQAFSLLLADIDHFKQINDLFGHLAGDAALKAIAGAIESSIRLSDTACRFGGEEFALIMPGTCGESAFHVAERLRRKIARLRIPELQEHPLTVSIGIRPVPAGDITDTTQVLAEADEALYTAKRHGRNRTEVHERLSPEGTDWSGTLSLPATQQA
ncbi:diguanylate cyclase [Desulfuromonas sp. AOP6]|uniref:GGDEF domain-containing protein n=1 Tax=Desulfuromonas sp. AOP6 TaxID=1566351 RepID=UPI001277987E|nr:diguanylate cyclase [Desulfuromonas sp. AOP6]BCA78959.1 diguanylate cyclase response regulator [Desulfuromonas sp. AOP6]